MSLPRSTADDAGEPYVPLRDQEQTVSRFRDHLQNPIIFRILVVVLLTNMASALWAGTLIVAFIFVLTDSNSRVGFIEAAQGLANLLFALPIGYLADKWSKAGIARIGALINMLNVGVLAWAVFRGSEEPDSSLAYFTIVGAMSVQGMVDAITSGPLQALYADVLPTGTRATAFTYVFALAQTGSALGPLATIVLFQTCGDTWTLPELRDVIFVGLGLSVLGALCMLTIPDVPSRTATGGEEKRMQADDSADGKRHGVAAAGGQKAAWDTRMVVPCTILIANVLSALGAGMTVKFFPLWFKNDVGLSPTGVQSIYLLNPLGMIVASQIGRRAAQRMGRIQTMLLFRGLGLACLLALILVQRVTVQWFVVVPIYLLRTILMNSTYPLQESIVMDFVPSESRGRWKAMGSVGKFGWCGSAALGGIILDRFDYSTTFAFTLALQGLGTCLTIPLLWLVPVREVDAAKEGREDGGACGGLDSLLLEGAEHSTRPDPRECREPGCVVCQWLSCQSQGLDVDRRPARLLAPDESEVSKPLG